MNTQHNATLAAYDAVDELENECREWQSGITESLCAGTAPSIIRQYDGLRDFHLTRAAREKAGGLRAVVVEDSRS